MLSTLRVCSILRYSEICYKGMAHRASTVAIVFGDIFKLEHVGSHVYFNLANKFDK